MTKILPLPEIECWLKGNVQYDVGHLNHVDTIEALVEESLPGRYPTRLPEPTLDYLDRLLDWLPATDAFGQEVKRLRLWRDFLADQSPNQAIENLETQ